MIPPHISFEQAKNLTMALVKGDPDEMRVIGRSAKSVLSGMFPHKESR
jgi:pyruvate dehydrogenase (quinone)